MPKIGVHVVGVNWLTLFNSAGSEYIREEKQKPHSLGRTFTLLLFEEAVHEKLGLAAEKVLWYRGHYRTGGYVAPEEMAELLRKSGWISDEAGRWLGA